MTDKEITFKFWGIRNRDDADLIGMVKAKNLDGALAIAQMFPASLTAGYIRIDVSYSVDLWEKS